MSAACGRPSLRVTAALWLGVTAMVSLGCAALPQASVGYNELDLAARTLHQRVHGKATMSRDQVRSIVADTIFKDRYRCIPSAAAVLARPQYDVASRVIAGNMPHYGMFAGPMRYRVGVSHLDNGRRVWLIMVNVALSAPDPDDTLQLPDCRLHPQLEGAKSCQGTPYQEDPGTDACPDSGHFEAPATRANVRALLAYWSSEVEGYYNRDAELDKLPIRYDFHFFLNDDSERARQPVDLALSLHSSCSRQPYFEGLRAGWSVPIVAHEMAHFLGLLDEYEPLSGITSLYPKTPFVGSETSRMGLSMKPDTRFYPLHHYLILRRFFCDADRPDAFSDILEP